MSSSPTTWSVHPLRKQLWTLTRFLTLLPVCCPPTQTHKDGRTSSPLFLINWSPVGAATEAMTLHASALSFFQVKADVAKVSEEVLGDRVFHLTSRPCHDSQVVQVREAEDLTTQVKKRAREVHLCSRLTNTDASPSSSRAPSLLNSFAVNDAMSPWEGNRRH